MKKIIKYLMLIIFTMISMTGCGLSKKIYLNMNNYEKYLKINTNVYNAILDDQVYVGSIEIGNGYSTFYMYKSYRGWLSIKGVSQNFNYNDVKIKVKISGDYKYYKIGDYKNPDSDSFEMTLEASTDIAGNSKDAYEDRYLGENVTHENLINYKVEVISVSGYVTPA